MFSLRPMIYYMYCILPLPFFSQIRCIPSGRTEPLGQFGLLSSAMTSFHLPQGFGFFWSWLKMPIKSSFHLHKIISETIEKTYVSTCFLLRKNNQMRNEEMCCDDGIMSQGANEDALNLVKDHAYRPTAAPSCYG